MDTNIIPVALFAYARPEHLKKTLEGLKRNQVPLIYAFCDGPKDESKKEAVTEVRRIIRAVNWAEIIITERETNLGLGTSVRDGVTKVLTKHEKVIVIEDDIVLRPGAYEYTCKALDFFEGDDRIMTISMWTHPLITPRNHHKGFLSERFVCWGWGTYKKYWELYKNSPSEIYQKCLSAGIKSENWGSDIKWQVDNAENRNLWYVGFMLIHFLYKKLSFFPNETLTLNIGRDPSGENTKGGKQDNMKLAKIPVENFNSCRELKFSRKTSKGFRTYFSSKRPNYLKKFLNAAKKLFQ
jgi:GT2 family glycosyltransferase